MINSNNLNIKCDNNTECAKADNNNNKNCQHNSTGAYQDNQYHPCYQNRNQYGNTQNNNSYPTQNQQNHQQYFQHCQTNQRKFHACKQICKFYMIILVEEYTYSKLMTLLFWFILLGFDVEIKFHNDFFNFWIQRWVMQKIEFIYHPIFNDVKLLIEIPQNLLFFCVKIHFEHRLKKDHPACYPYHKS